MPATGLRARLNPLHGYRCVLYTRFAPPACRTFVRAALDDEYQHRVAEFRQEGVWALWLRQWPTHAQGTVSERGFSLSAAGQRSSAVTTGRFVPTADGGTRVEISVRPGAMSLMSMVLGAGWAATWAWLVIQAGLYAVAPIRLSLWLIVVALWLVLGLGPLVAYLLLRRMPEAEHRALGLVQQALDGQPEPASGEP